VSGRPGRIAVRYVSALISGDREGVFGCLSRSFSVHEGRDAERHVSHELEAFERLGERRGLRRSGAEWAVLPRTPSGRVASSWDGRTAGFFLVDGSGALIYEDALVFGRFGAESDGSWFETVPKLRSFASAVGGELVVRGPSLRGVAVALGDPFPEACLATRPRATFQEWLPSGPDPDYGSFSFSFPDDGGLTLEGRLRLSGTFRSGERAGERVSESKALLLRGLDHPFAESRAFPFPSPDGRSVVVPATRAVPWSICCVFEDGGTEILEAPPPGLLFFQDRRLRSATLTDATDNDWETSREGPA
jgi:hypothetical protein